MTREHSIAVFKNVSAQVWNLLTRAYNIGVSMNEETITDLATMGLFDARPLVEVRALNKLAEATIGADWDWWIGSSELGWARYLIQSKRLFLPDGKYRSLRHKCPDKKKPQMQIERLKQFAHQASATPLYCFYNGGMELGLGPSDLEWGCTLAPLARVELAHATYASRRFEDLHGGSDGGVP
jgi:hypothetical protein